MIPYILLGVGSLAAVAAALLLMLAPTECFVMQNDFPQPTFPDRPYYPQPLRIPTEDTQHLFSKKILSKLEESDVITVDNPPGSVLGAALFWAGEGATIVTDSRVPYRTFHVECSDPVSKTVLWIYPSAFPNSRYVSEVHIP